MYFHVGIAILCLCTSFVTVTSRASTPSSRQNSEQDFYPSRNESSQCQECSCGPRPNCLPGISTLMDGCGCCLICAKQLGQSCDLRNVCDRHRALYCDETTGTCKASPGRPCLVAGKWYDNGAVFQPSCKAKCSCADGTIGCAPTCLDEVRPAPPLGCSHPRLLRRKDQCCPEWRCVTNDQLDQYERVGNQVERSSPIRVLMKENCMVQISKWSECSKSCGFGVSQRVTNDNPDCRFEKQTRLCSVRSCLAQQSPKTRRGCRKTIKHANRVRFSLSGCVSTSIYRLKYCGTCAGKCCQPSKSKTISVNFECKEDGKTVSTFTRQMMMIKRCACKDTPCQSLADLLSMVGHGLGGDTVRRS